MYYTTVLTVFTVLVVQSIVNISDYQAKYMYSTIKFNTVVVINTDIPYVGMAGYCIHVKYFH